MNLCSARRSFSAIHQAAQSVGFEIIATSPFQQSWDLNGSLEHSVQTHSRIGLNPLDVGVNPLDVPPTPARVE
jgi:hypothetical protein